MITYYIAFFKYDDSTIWQRTSLFKERKLLEEYVTSITYLNPTTVNIFPIELPN